MTGKSAAMIRRSSSRTRSSSGRTVRWISDRVMGASWDRTLPTRLGEHLHPVADVLESDVHGEDALVVSQGIRCFSLLFFAPPQPIQQADLVFISSRVLLDRASEHGSPHRGLA